MCQSVEDYARSYAEEYAQEREKKGRQEGIVETIKNLIKDGTLSIEKIASIVKMPVEEVQRIAAQTV